MLAAPPKPLSGCALLHSRAIASAPAATLKSSLSRQSADQVTLWRSAASTAVMPGSTGLLPCQLDSYSSTQQTSVIRCAQGVAEHSAVTVISSNSCSASVLLQKQDDKRHTGCDVICCPFLQSILQQSLTSLPDCCSCEALPKGKKGLPQKWAVALQHSPFYPEGGGQPSDGGTLQPQGEAHQVQTACHLHLLLLWVVRQPAIELMMFDLAGHEPWPSGSIYDSQCSLICTASRPLSSLLAPLSTLPSSSASC